MTAGVDLIGIITVQIAFYFGLVLVFGSADAGQWSDWSILSQLGSGGLWGVPTWIFIGAGCALIVAGFFASWALLRRQRVARPTAFTWAAVAISVIPCCVVTPAAYLAASIISSYVDPANPLGDSATPSLLCIMLAVQIVLSVAVGALVWWWMAHLFRAQPTAA